MENHPNPILPTQGIYRSRPICESQKLKRNTKHKRSMPIRRAVFLKHKRKTYFAYRAVLPKHHATPLTPQALQNGSNWIRFVMLTLEKCFRSFANSRGRDFTYPFSRMAQALALTFATCAFLRHLFITSFLLFVCCPDLQFLDNAVKLPGRDHPE